MGFVTVSELGEHALLARVLARLPRPGPRLLVGPGDDGAVIEVGRGHRLVVTTDSLVEGVHFSRAWCSAGDVGYKALAVSLSDLAAMGARPRWALLGLAVPPDYLVADADALVDGVAALARTAGLSIAGGNITRSPGHVVIDVTAGGEARPRRWLMRSGARPGDEIWLSGTIGGAAAGLEMLRTSPDGSPTDALAATCVSRYRRPDPRTRLGLAVAQVRAARAAMDLSDGLGDAVSQVARASGCGAVVRAGALPIDEGARAWWERRGVDPVVSAVSGGDDYELLFAVPAAWRGRMRQARRHAATPPLTVIGVMTRDPAIVLERDGRQEAWPSGFEHFARGRA